MPNFDFITDRLATGGDLPGHTNSAWIAELDGWLDHGITHIVDNRFEWSDEHAVAEFAPSLRYLHNGVDDHGGVQPDEWFERGTDWVRHALQDGDAKVLIHCHMGINRGPSLAFAVLLDQGWDPVHAIDAIRRSRPIAYVLYAEDALDWHHRRTDAPQPTRSRDLQRLAAWRQDHPLDVRRIIRAIRAGETPQVA